MKRYLVAHEDWVLAVIGIFLAAMVITLFVWSVARISGSVASALTAGGQNAGKLQFNIEQLKSTDLRGLQSLNQPQ
jgi:hypothetical protein